MCAQDLTRRLFASGNGFIAIRPGQAVPGPDLPDPDNAGQFLSCWQEAFEEELGALDDMGGRILPGMLSMLGEQFDSVVFPVLKLLYRLAGEEWLDTGSLMSSLGPDAGGSGTPLREVFLIDSTARLMKILCDFGAAAVDWGTTKWRSDHAAAITIFTDSTLAKPEYRMRLTPLGRYGIRNILASEGHTARRRRPGRRRCRNAARRAAVPRRRWFRHRAQRMAGWPR